jgi:serine/threonine protein kinase/tetratricopeptide (TPR) repeat protein
MTRDPTFPGRYGTDALPADAGPCRSADGPASGAGVPAVPEEGTLTVGGAADELPPPPRPVPVAAEGALATTRVPPPQAPVPGPPPLIPGYEIVGELGRGGMGVVYRARQTGLNRLVALKTVLHGAQAGSERRARFRVEAEAAARLQHPNIAQIYEIGEYGGEPYFSLEYVDGPSLAHRLDGTPLPARAAARLVEKLARAMQYAHERGVVHRDLKPANILLQRTEDRGQRTDEEGSGAIASVRWPLASVLCPKITDFGLAKILAEDGPDRTRTGLVLGTPSYMAPEQAAGTPRDVGPACDVYALGAILYELLTGRPPFKGATTLETVRQVVAEEPVPLTHLQRSVPRDLETVCLKCLEKEPRKRYATAGGLADDLRRFLNNEPIHARPVGRVERLVRWCRRNPRVAGLLVALLLVLAVGFAGVTWQWRRARAERDEAEASYQLTRRVVADYFETLGRDPQLEDPGALPLRKEMLQTALTHFQYLLQDRGDDADLQAGLATGYYRLGEITVLTGAPEEAIEPYRQAIAVQEELAGRHPDATRFRRDLARSYSGVGTVHRMLRQWPESHEAIEESLRIRKELAANDPGDPALRRELAHSFQALGFLHHAEDKHAEGLRLMKDALALREELARQAPGDPAYQSDLAGGLNDTGLVLEDLNRHPEALDLFRRAIHIQQPVFTGARQAVRHRHLLSVLHFNMARVLGKMGRADEAAEAAQQCRKLNPENPEYLCYAARGLAMAANAVGRGKAKLSSEEQVERRRYADQAIEVLQEAVNYGYANRDLLRIVPELKPFRSRPDFEKLMAVVDKRAAKAGK